MEGNCKKKEKHFVLVHGMCQGAWCWYKLIPLLKKQGRVTALDMAASGANPKAIEDVGTFQEYNKPLIDFMASLSVDEKVILVGHSFGGMNIAFAIERFPQNISAAVYLAALIPDTIHQPSFIINKLVESVPEDGWYDSQFWTYGSPEVEEPLTAALFGPQFIQSVVAPLSPIEDYELAMTMQRPSSLFIPDLTKTKRLSSNVFNSVRQIYVISKEDKAITENFARWMIENSGVQQVREIEGADHMTMLSKPQLLCDCLLDIARV